MRHYTTCQKHKTITKTSTLILTRSIYTPILHQNNTPETTKQLQLYVESNSHITLYHTLIHLTVYNSPFTNHCTCYYVFNSHNITDYANVIITHAFVPPLLLTQLFHQMAVTQDQASVANIHACNRKSNTLQ